MPVNLIFSDRTPKESESLTDCQDYFEVNEARGCCAIADGASQSFYPAIWAELLVQHFCENPEISASNWKTWLEPIQAQWLAEVRSRVETAKSQGKPTWIEGYNGLTSKRSATSTFIGLRFSEDKINACIVGDSCLFVLRNQNLKSYPLEHSRDFNDRPEYFASDPKDNHFQPYFFDVPLNVEQSDQAYLILATDALSEYVLRCVEQKESIFSSLLKISTPEQFKDFVASARQQTVRMKNDDVTLLVLQYNLSSPHNSSQVPTDPVQEEAKPSVMAGNRPQPQTQKPHKKNSTRNGNRSNFVGVLLHGITDRFVSLLNTSPVMEQPAPNPSQKRSKIITRLKKQRAILIFMMVCLPLLSFWIGRVGSKPNQPTTQTTTSSNVIPRPTQLSKGSRIYADQELKQPLIMSLFNPSKALIVEEGDKWIKFQVELYAYNDIILPCPSCNNKNEIEIRPAENLRVAPSEDNANTFGQLNIKTKFQRVDFTNLIPRWYKFRFVGYIAK